MDPIPAPVLPNVAAIDSAPARNAGADVRDDFGAFEQALENEIAVMGETPLSAHSPAHAAVTPAANPDTAARIDGAQFLELILDSSGMVVPAAVPFTTAPLHPADAPSGVAAETADAAIISASFSRTSDGASKSPSEALRVTSPAAASRQEPRVAQSVTAGAVPELVTERMLTTQQRLSAAEEALLQPRMLVLPGARSVSSQPLPEPVAMAGLESPPSMIAAPAHGLSPLPEKAAALRVALEATGTQDSPSADTTAADGRADPSREAVKTRSATDDPFLPRTELRMTTDAANASGISAAPLTATASAEPREIAVPIDSATSAVTSPWATAPGQNAGSAVTTPAVLRVETPLPASGWTDAFRQQVVWMVDRNVEAAEIHVNPPHLGPVEVVLEVTDEGARIAFSSPHAAVRDAIEASLAELRASLAERGLALGEALVSADPGSAREQMLRDEEVARAPRKPETSEAAPEAEVRVQPVRRGLVDTFV